MTNKELLKITSRVGSMLIEYGAEIYINATFGYLIKMTFNNFGVGFYRTDIS